VSGNALGSERSREDVVTQPVDEIRGGVGLLAGIGGSGEAFTVALGVDDPDAARAALGKRVVG
jgi:hypothetical protein